MPDRWRERLTFWVSLLSLVTGLGVIASAATGKLGVMVVGPPDIIAQVAHVDSVRAAGLDSALTFRVNDAAKTHARMDSIDQAQERRILTLEALASQQMALSCVNTKPRDLVLVRIPCGQYIERWRAPGAQP